ncbi:ketoacyl-ACP synthase III family protein [Nocardia sp. NBC_01499]|uniref:ketoacyl-ACP synthase III family protein n=1 Tax=Nocardia sp. NBC_01499 TaxID=2903597 RepID=UPI00386431C0
MKLGAGLGIRSVTTWLPDTLETADAAVAHGQLTDEELTDGAIAALPVSHDLAAPEMAVLAARRALDTSGIDPATIGLVVHSWIHHQGHDFWSPAHYVAHSLGAVTAEAVGVQAMCNGGGAALELGAARLLADPDTNLVLATTADRFHDSSFDRWAGDFGVYYGDGATAVLLGRRDDARDELTLLALTTATVSGAESLHRGADAFSQAPRQHSARIDVRRTKKAYLERFGVEDFQRDVHAALRHAVSTALDDAGLSPQDARITHLTLPRIGMKVRRSTYYDALDGFTAARILELGEKTGHLGAGDLAANCAELGGLLESGDIALSISAGGGFGFTCAVVQRPAEPTA